MFASLIVYQILDVAGGAAFALALCFLARRIRRKGPEFTPGDLVLAMVLSAPAAALLLYIAYLAFKLGTIESAYFFLVIGILFYTAFFWFPLACLRFALARRSPPGRSPLPPVSLPLRVAFFLYVLISFSIAFYAWFIEPSKIETSRHALSLSRLQPMKRPIRIVHISDIQTSYLGSREMMIAPTVEELKPDLILFTGDLFSRAMFGEAPRESAAAVLSRLSAPFGFFGVPGDSESPEDAASLLQANEMILLRNETRLLKVRGQTIAIHGLDRDFPDLSFLDQPVPEDAIEILLAHSPDLVLDLNLDLDAPFRGNRESLPVPSGRLPDLILAGHTHGGQIVLPVVGAPITFSRLGSRYASGLFDFGETILHISRGIGMEGHFAPRVRFRCPPEITLITISANSLP